MDALQIYKIIINTLLNSIPEELFFVLFVYILMGEFDHWKDEDCKTLFRPFDYARILVPAVFAAIASNIIRYSGASTISISFGTLFAIFIGIVAMGDIFNNARAAKWVGEVFLFLLLASLCLVMMEFLYLPIVVYGIDTSLQVINNNMLYNFLLSLPGKIMQYSLLAFLVLRKRSLLKARILKMVFNSKVLTIITIITFLVNYSFTVIMLKVVYYEKVLNTVSFELRLIIMLGIWLFPILNLLALLGCTYYVKNSEAISKKEASDIIMKIVEEISTNSIKSDYEDIKWSLNGLKSTLEGVATGLYFEEKDKRG